MAHPGIPVGREKEIDKNHAFSLVLYAEWSEILAKVD
jgi:hypothetical protein